MNRSSRTSHQYIKKYTSKKIQTQMGLTRLTSEPNVYRNNEQTMFVMVYVDDLLFLGQQQEVDKTFKEVQKHVLLRPTGTLGIGQTIQFLGRDIHNNGDLFEVSLKPEYITTLLKETKMETSNSASAPGTATLKQSTNDEAPLDAQEHADYRRAVGKLQWLTYTRPDISFATKELARELQQPTQQSLRKVKHLLRYLRGTQHYKMILRTTHTHHKQRSPSISTSTSMQTGQDARAQESQQADSS